MRAETVATWTFVGFGLLMIGALLYALQVTDGTLPKFLGTVGGVYFCIGIVLTVMHNRHMIKRTRAGQE
ncbi:MAG: hypothetical protein ACTHMB_17075 [Candidatus Binatia bacterium]|jgi:hypothetical protein